MDKNVNKTHRQCAKRQQKKKLLNIKHVGQRQKKKVTMPEAFERKYVFRVSDKAIAQFSNVHEQGSMPAYLLAKYVFGINIFFFFFLQVLYFSVQMKKNYCFLVQTLIHDMIFLKKINEVYNFLSKQKTKTKRQLKQTKR